MGYGADAVLRTHKQIFDSFGRLIRRILHILRVSGYRHAAVGIQENREACQNTNQQNACGNDVFPRRPLSGHMGTHLQFQIETGLSGLASLFSQAVRFPARVFHSLTLSLT